MELEIFCYNLEMVGKGSQKNAFPEHRWRYPSLAKSVQCCLVEMFYLSLATKTDYEPQLKQVTREEMW